MTKANPPGSTLHPSDFSPDYGATYALASRPRQAVATPAREREWSGTRTTTGDDAARLVSIAARREAEGKMAEAEKLYLTALALKARGFGKPHPGCLPELRRLADLYLKISDLKRAQEFGQQALSLSESDRDAPLADLRGDLSRLALIFERQGKYGRAASVYGRVVELEERQHGYLSPELERALSDLAASSFRAGDYQRTRCVLGRLLESLERSCPAADAKVVDCLERLAALLVKQAHCLSSTSNTAARTPQQKGQAIYELAAFFHGQRRLREAAHLYRRAIELLEEPFPVAALPAGAGRPCLEDEQEGPYLPARRGRDQSTAAASLNILARIRAQSGSPADAEALFKRAEIIWEGALPRQHPEIVQGLNDRADLYFGEGRSDEGEATYLEALELRKDEPTHPVTVKTLCGLARLYLLTARYQEAATLIEQAWATIERFFKHDRALSAEVLTVRARLHHALSEFQKAEDLYRRALALMEPSAAYSATDTAAILNCLADIYLRRRRFQDAEQLCHQALACLENTYPDIPGNAAGGDDRQIPAHLTGQKESIASSRTGEAVDFTPDGLTELALSVLEIEELLEIGKRSSSSADPYWRRQAHLRAICAMRRLANRAATPGYNQVSAALS